jgi:aldehyde:ferredoxin oxidoreductase
LNDGHGQYTTTSTPRGCHGRYLRVDLETSNGSWWTLSDRVLRDFLGGTGLGAYLMLTEGQAAIDPLAAESCIAFVFSPLVGSPLTTSAKFAVVSKSPLTDRYNDSLVSSGFAIAGKHCGADAIVVTGRAKEPSVLVIDNGQVRLLPAGQLWGATTSQTQTALKSALGADFQLAVIGPAGEKRVRYATISHDGRHAGRGGAGAILGSKQLKAIAVRGQQRCAWAHPQALYEYAKTLSRRSMEPATAKYRELGTATNLLTFNRLNTLPTRNFQRGRFEGAERIAPETLTQSRARARASCAACTIGCEHLYELNTDRSSDGTKVRLEYESLFALGSLCDIGDPDVVLRASHLCDELGLDTISAGGTIAFAMECTERGWLREEWLKFGDGGALLRALAMIAQRTGIGEHLAQGSRRLARLVGPQAEDLAPHVKGLELPGYDPRGAQSMALGFAVGARGADHNRSGAYEADFSELVDRRQIDHRSVTAAIATENRAALIDSLILCKFLRGIFTDLFAEAAQMLNLACGWDVTAAELATTSERIVAAKKLFNVRCGWTPHEDRLPARFFDVPLADDPVACLALDEFQCAIEGYNQQRGWTKAGWIPAAELRRLGLERWAPPTLLPAPDAVADNDTTLMRAHDP